MIARITMTAVEAKNANDAYVFARQEVRKRFVEEPLFISLHAKATNAAPDVRPSRFDVTIVAQVT